MKTFFLVLIALALVMFRLDGNTSLPFQAVAHLFVGFLLGSNRYLLALSLSGVEVLCFGVSLPEEYQARVVFLGLLLTACPATWAIVQQMAKVKETSA